LENGRTAAAGVANLHTNLSVDVDLDVKATRRMNDRVGRELRRQELRDIDELLRLIFEHPSNVQPGLGHGVERVSQSGGRSSRLGGQDLG